MHPASPVCVEMVFKNQSLGGKSVGRERLTGLQEPPGVVASVFGDVEAGGSEVKFKGHSWQHGQFQVNLGYISQKKKRQE